MRDVIKRLSDMTEELTTAVKQFDSAAGDELSGIGPVDGVPILTRSNPASLFEVPSDYKLRKP